MLIDAFTIIAQVVNFLVLAAVLKFVLYDRIVAVIDQRQTEIREQIEEADEREAAASEARQRYEQQRLQLQEEQEELLASARRRAEDEHERLLDEAREEVDNLRERWRAGVERERHRLLSELQHRAADEVVTVTGETLRELADTRLEEQVVAVGLERLAGHREALVGALAAVDDAQVVTAFELRDGLAERATKDVRDLVGRPELPLSFAVDPNLVCGFELHAGDHAFGWNVAAHLEALRRRVDRFIHEELGSEDDPGRAGDTP